MSCPSFSIDNKYLYTKTINKIPQNMLYIKYVKSLDVLYPIARRKKNPGIVKSKSVARSSEMRSVISYLTPELLNKSSVCLLDN